MTRNEEMFELNEDLSRHLLTAGGSNGLDLIRELPSVTVRARGNQLFLGGDPVKVKLVKRFLNILAQRLNGNGMMDVSEMKHLFRELTSDNPVSPSSAPGAGEEPFDEILVSHSGRSIRPKTANQRAYIEAMRTHEITVSIGPAGTGKTYLAIAMAVRALKEKQVSRLILSRPTIEAGEKLGYLPGDILEKVDPHFRPLYDAIQEFLGVSRFQQLLRQGIIEITPLGFMRGRTFNEAFIVLDEAQNTTLKQMRMFLTRMGYGSRVVVTGDRTQIDLPSPRDSALSTLQAVLGRLSRVAFLELGDRDVIRHELVREIIQAYEAFFREESEDGKR